MALIYRPGQTVTLPIVFWDSSINTGRTFVPNSGGTLKFPGVYAAPGLTGGATYNVTGYQWFQQGAFAHDANNSPFPFNLQYYGMFHPFAYTEFVEYGDASNIGNGDLLSLAHDGLTMTVRLPSDASVFISYPTGGSLQYWNRYSIGLRLTDPSMPGATNSITFWSDFFDITNQSAGGQGFDGSLMGTIRPHPAL